MDSELQAILAKRNPGVKLPPREDCDWFCPDWERYQKRVRDDLIMGILGAVGNVLLIMLIVLVLRWLAVDGFI